LTFFGLIFFSQPASGQRRGVGPQGGATRKRTSRSGADPAGSGCRSRRIRRKFEPCYTVVTQISWNFHILLTRTVAETEKNTRSREHTGPNPRLSPTSQLKKRDKEQMCPFGMTDINVTSEAMTDINGFKWIST
jgi:hypothetical protein